MKNKMKALYFWANWDGEFYKKLNNFINEAKRHRIQYETIDVETKDGVAASIKYGVRNVPTIVILDDNKVLAVLKGNDAYKEIARYFK